LITRSSARSGCHFRFAFGIGGFMLRFGSRQRWCPPPLAAWLLWVGLASLSGCFEHPARPVLGYEQGDLNCQDGIDNDQDGLIDCSDIDCAWSTGYCGEVIPVIPTLEPETTPAKCRDFIDNDQDGSFDCGDRNCQGVPEACCLLEFDDKSCSDGIDNDHNGFADCLDYGCAKGMFVSVCVENTDALCADGKDNNGDKKIDCDDKNCSKAKPCQPTGVSGPEDTTATCMDHFDNDGDGFADCKDYSCSQSKDAAIAAACANLPGETSLAQCTDHVDNDGNGYADCADYSCTKSIDPAILDYCLAISEDTLAKCRDGKDNDSNKYADCDDRSCTGSTTIDTNVVCGDPSDCIDTAAKYCASIMEVTFAKCTDRIDNDHNGYADCADYSCRQNADMAVRQACQESLGTDTAENNARCSDGKDNDLDGAVDCDDWDCSWNPGVTVCSGPKVCELGHKPNQTLAK